MAILTKDEIAKRIKEDNLIIDAHLENGEPVVEPASYDLRAGIIIWKESGNNKEIMRKDFDPLLPLDKQDMVTIQPGQVMFIITREMVNMPLDLCGTVYAKNEFSRAGILLFTTGHVDPGIQCPIVIRLVNLRAIPFSLNLGHPIYTIVFQTIKQFEGGVLTRHANISMQDTILRTRSSAEQALDNALYDLSLLNNFIKKDEFGELASSLNFIKEDELGKAAWKWVKNNTIRFLIWFIAVLVFLATLVGGIVGVLEIIDRSRDSGRDSNGKSKTEKVTTTPLPQPVNNDSTLTK